MSWSDEEDRKFNEELWAENNRRAAAVGAQAAPPTPGWLPGTGVPISLQDRQAFCRGCARMFFVQRKRQKICSEECLDRVRQLGRCSPVCAEFEDIPVTFRDGTQHVKRVCKRCRRGNYVHQGTPLSKKEKEAKRFEYVRAALAKKGAAPSSRFYLCLPWRELRYAVLKKRGAKCECCHSTQGPFHVDHIKPRSKYPELELELEESNLQVLCADCNMGKGAWDDTDWRNH